MSNINTIVGRLTNMVVLLVVKWSDMALGPKTTSKTDEYALSLGPQSPHILGIQTVLFS